MVRGIGTCLLAVVHLLTPPILKLKAKEIGGKNSHISEVGLSSETFQ